MDWKRLVQFALLGSGDCEHYAILLVRVSIGLFFAISWANKLFVTGGTKPVYDTLVKAKIPFPTRWLISCGVSSLLQDRWRPWDFFSSLACVALVVDIWLSRP